MIIAVDMMAYKPLGENGGAAPLIISILQKLSNQNNIKLILLTGLNNHDSLSFLDGPSVERFCIENVFKNQTILQKLLCKLKMCRNTRSFQEILPGTMQVDFSSLVNQNIDIMFCPFTAINYYDEKVKTVITLHDLQHKYFPEFFSPEELFQRDRFYSNIQKLKPMIISVSDFSRNSFLENYDYPADRITTIHTAIQDRFCNYPASGDKKYLELHNLEKNDFIFYPANFWRHKNHENLFKAFSLVCAKHPDNTLKLVLTGFPVEGMDKWNNLTEMYNISERVFFLGYVCDEEMAALFRNCKMLVFPSLFEGFGIPVIEAMSMGAPIACSNVTALPETGGNCVFYFNPNDPKDICKTILYILNHPKEVENKLNMYPEHLADYSCENYINKIVDLFNSL